MTRLTKWLYLSSIFLVLFTLAKDLPPYRIYLLDLALAPCLLILILHRILDPGKTSFVWQRIDTLIVVLLVSVTVALAFSEDVTHSIVGYLDWVRIIAIYFASRMVFPGVVSEQSWRRLFWVSASVLLIIGAIQAITGTSFGLIGNYFGVGLDQGGGTTIQGIGSRSRISGTTSNPIVFAMWLTMFSLFVSADLITKKRYILFVVISFISAIVVLNTLSRGAIAAFVLSWLLLVFMYRQELVRLVFGSMLFMTLFMPIAYYGMQSTSISGAASMLQSRFEHQALLEEDSGRVQVMKIGLSLLGEPKVFLVGTGPDNLVYAYNKYIVGVKGSNYGKTVNKRSGVHNVWIKMVVEYGVITAIIFIIIWVDAVRRTRRLWKNKNMDQSARSWGGYLTAFLIPYLIIDCGVYESAMSYHVLIPLFAILGYLVTKTEIVRRVQNYAEPAAVNNVRNQPVLRRRY